MPQYTVKVKWAREQFSGIVVNTDEEPILFKAQLFALTGVQPERQKIMCKGGILRDNEWNLSIKDGTTILLLGTKEEVPQPPVEPIKFIEDMNEAEIATVLELPAGLTNLGNTCYMNATLQCLHSVPELRDALGQFTIDGNGGDSMSIAITSAMKYLFKQMEVGSTVTPLMLLQTLHRAFPQFSQTGENGSYRQQDANECWSELLKMLQQKLPVMAKSTNGVEAVAAGNRSKCNSFIEQFFGGSFEIKMSCSEAPEEEVVLSKENFLQLSCFISPEVRYMLSGLKSRMKETLLKFSENLGRDANYDRTYSIARLPAYLTVQFVRFQYKGKEGINAKILKDIKFPIDFDAFELCTPELCAKLEPMRSKFKEVDDQKVNNQIKKSLQESQSSNNDENPAKSKKQVIEYEPYWFAEDFGSNNSGYYTLQAVLTHKGRSSSSGHYVAWVKHNNDIWFKFDDDVVTSVSSEDILRLSGGGDWHCAYVLLYGPKLLPKAEEVAKESHSN